MAKPRMFISSTHADLDQTKIEIGKFLKKFDYEPVFFENDDITFAPNELIENSCYEEIKNCDFFILIIKNKFGSHSISDCPPDNTNCKITSVTQNEYLTAIKLGIPVQVFIHKSSLDEYNSFKSQGSTPNFTFHYLENIHLANFIDEIYRDKSFRYIQNYNKVDDIKRKLRKLFSGLFQKQLKNARNNANRNSDIILINSFKFFFFRRHSGLSQEKLALKTKIPVQTIQKIEDAAVKSNHIKNPDFVSLNLDDARKISNVLQCHIGNLKAGLPDDFLAEYLNYYFKNKGTYDRKNKKHKPKTLFTTKAIVFDFDGTITKPENRLTSWEEIWLKLGYDINDCASLHKQYSNFEITHKKWCDLTEKKFKEKQLNKSILNEIAMETKIIQGAAELFEELYEKGIQLFICSGSIDYLIKEILGESFQYFDEIKANRFLFNKNGSLKRIIGTKYDFEGKSTFIQKIAKENQIDPWEVLFIGNSLNDEWAHQSGAETLCVNPSMTNPDHPFQWTHTIREMNNLNEIKQFITE